MERRDYHRLAFAKAKMKKRFRRGNRRLAEGTGEWKSSLLCRGVRNHSSVHLCNSSFTQCGELGATPAGGEVAARQQW